MPQKPLATDEEALRRHAALVTQSFMDRSDTLAAVLRRHYPNGAHARLSLSLSVSSLVAKRARSTSCSPVTSLSAACADAEGVGLVGELQFAFVSFIYGQSEEGLEQWKTIAALLCNCERALAARPVLFCVFVGERPRVRPSPRSAMRLRAEALMAQLADVPGDLFVDPLSKENFLRKSLRVSVSAMAAAAAGGTSARKLTGPVPPRAGLIRHRDSDRAARRASHADTQAQSSREAAAEGACRGAALCVGC